MRKLAVLLAMALLAGCASMGKGENEVRRDADVSAATAAWVSAYNSRDPARITSLYDAEAVLWGTTSPILRATPAAIAEYFKDAAKRPDARVEINERHVRVFGDTAVSTGAYTFTDVREGKAVSNPARFTFVYRFRGGRWVIVDHHSSRVPAP